MDGINQPKILSEFTVNSTIDLASSPGPALGGAWGRGYHRLYIISYDSTYY